MRIQRDAGLVRLRVDEFTAHPVPRGRIADRLRSRQCLDGQLLTITFRQPRRRANTSVPARTHLKNQGGIIRPGTVNPASRVTHL
jgi:hypothetical protein